VRAKRRKASKSYSLTDEPIRNFHPRKKMIIAILALVLSFCLSVIFSTTVLFLSGRDPLTEAAEVIKTSASFSLFVFGAICFFHWPSGLMGSSLFLLRVTTFEQIKVPNSRQIMLTRTEGRTEENYVTKKVAIEWLKKEQKFDKDLPQMIIEVKDMKTDKRLNLRQLEEGREINRRVIEIE
jgi:hypothetical protein